MSSRYILLRKSVHKLFEFKNIYCHFVGKKKSKKKWLQSKSIRRALALATFGAMYRIKLVYIIPPLFCLPTKHVYCLCRCAVDLYWLHHPTRLYLALVLFFIINYYFQYCCVFTKPTACPHNTLLCHAISSLYDSFVI